MTPVSIPSEVIDWLLAGDVAIQYQVRRDLLGEEHPDLRPRIAVESWERSSWPLAIPTATGARGTTSQSGSRPITHCWT